MTATLTHIEEPILTGREGSSFTPMYSMHKYWSKKSSEIIAEYINKYTNEGDIILDAFSGSGVTIFEALKQGRRAIGIDINPIANFITRVTLEPVNLSHLMWAFRDIEQFCEDTVSELFHTRCPICGKSGTIDFVVRHKNDPIQIGYACTCSQKRLFKQPDEDDKRMDTVCNQMEIPFWYPDNTLLPTSRKEEFQYVHELFTRRNIIALSSILHIIESIHDQRVQNVMKLAFSGALDKCSRLKPLSKQNTGRYNLREAWVAVRFYTPPKWQEVNPLKAFKRSFLRVYEGKKESNKQLANVVIGSSFKDLESGAANVVIFQGSSDKIIKNELPKRSIDYVLTDPPFGSAIPYLSLSTFWGAWLGLDFDYDQEIVIDTKQGKTRDVYNKRMQAVFGEIGEVAKKGSYTHVFYNDAKGPYLHMILKNLMEAGISPERIIHQPPPSSFSTIARTHKGHYGAFIIRGKNLGARVSQTMPLFESELRRKIAETARQTLMIQNGETTIGSVLHSVYKRLDQHEISIYAQYDAEKFVLDSVSEFARLHNSKGNLKLNMSESVDLVGEDTPIQLREAVLDAEALLASETEIHNIIIQLAQRRLNMGGITPEDIRHVRNGISESEKREHRKQLFSKLLSDFGRELGYRTTYSESTINSLAWTRENSLGCFFELTDKYIRVFTSLSQNDKTLTLKLGTIPYFSLVLKLTQWCKDNPNRGTTIRHTLIGIQGPSYNQSSNDDNKLNDYRQIKLKVLRNVKVCPEHYLIQLSIPKNMQFNITPGQFLHIECDPDNGESKDYPLTLRRPFSIHGAQYAGFERSFLAQAGEIPIEIRDILERNISMIDILYKVVGAGTTNLSEKVRQGDVLDVIGPCGKGFSIGSQNTAIIVAGGIGIAPLVALAERLRYLDKQVYVYFGALKKELLQLAMTRPDSIVDLGYTNGTNEFIDVIKYDFKEIGVKEIRVCTEDGLLDEKGLITDLLERDLNSNQLPNTEVCIYSCGPRGMLQSVAKIAEHHSIECQVLLEERMACGIGACLSCACEVVSLDGTVEKKRVCRDGPVFNSREIKWTN